MTTTTSQAARQVDLRYFLILLGPVFILGCHKIIGTHLMPKDLEVPAEILREGHNWLEAAGRYRFLATTWLFGLLSLLTFALFARSLLRATQTRTRIAAMAVCSIILILAALPSLRDFGNVDGGQVYDRLGSAVYEGVMSRGTLRGCTTPQDTWLLGTCGAAPVVSMFSSVVDVVNIFVGLALGALVVGMILCLNTRPCGNVEEEAALLAENLRNMRYQLYLSGLVLSFGMLYAASWIYWPLPLVEASAKADYGAVLLSASLYTGVYFSLLILSFYLPVAFILDGRVKALAAKASALQPTDQSQGAQAWRASRGLKEEVGDYLRAGFALVSPILAAFAGGISPLLM